MKKTAENALLQVKDLSVEFNVKKSFLDNVLSRQKKMLRAVDGDTSADAREAVT